MHDEVLKAVERKFLENLDESIVWGEEEFLDFVERKFGTTDTTGELRAAVCAKLRRLQPDQPPLFDEGSSGETKERSFGHYRILRQLGAGGQAGVFLARDTKLRRDVALKLLPGLASEDARARFKREATAAARLNHPGICPVFEAGEIDGTSYIAMAYINGPNLRHLVGRAKKCGHHCITTGKARIASIDGIVTVFESIARALHVAHTNGVLHRDLTPSNIMLLKGRPFIVDFGLARDSMATHGLTIGSPGGTPRYMSPEQVSGHGGVESDIYSLGATLYECLSLVPIFAGVNFIRINHNIKMVRPKDPRKFNRHIPRDLATVVFKCLEKKIEHRYRSAEMLADDLMRITRKAPILARRPRRVTRFWRWLFLDWRRVASFGAATAIVVFCYSIIAETILVRDNLANENDLDELESALEQVHLWNLDHRQKILELISSWAGTKEGGEARAAHTIWAMRQQLHKVKWDLDEDRLTATASAVRAARLIGRLVVAAMRLWKFETIEGRFSDNWNDVIDALRRSDGKTASTLYQGMSVSRQHGLVPLGMNPNSKLWEFGCVYSAEGTFGPHWDKNFGAMVRAPGDGLVFVLVPGGNVLCDGRVVYVEPFFISKFELTQSQWLRAERWFRGARDEPGRNPSVYRAGCRYISGSSSFEVTPCNPVECVSFQMCERVLGRAGLLIPTEAEWTRAATLGGPLDRVENPSPSPHQPVSAGKPGRTGLFGLWGNVAEWVRTESATNGFAVAVGQSSASQELRRELGRNVQVDWVGIRVSRPIIRKE